MGEEMSEPESSGDEVKWKTVGARKAACDRFCDHIRQGFSMDCFPEASARTIRHYAKAYPEDFPAEKLEAAAREGLLVWEQLGLQGAKGEIAKFSATAWMFNMKNRAGWRDRQETRSETVAADQTPAKQTVKPRPTGEIALSMMALMAQAEYERWTDGDDA